MDKATRDCLVTGYRSLIPSLNLPDPNDRHVLAAAIAGRSDAMITYNLKDFPNPCPASHLPPDPCLFCQVVRTIRARLRCPTHSVDDYLAVLSKQGLIATVAELRQFKDSL